MAGALVNSAAAPRETYNVPHKIPWHWQVPAYLVTKAIGAGVFMIAAAGVALDALPATPLFTTIAAGVALLFITLTTALLVWDLDRPERFWTILIRPQWKSWLARGAFVLIAFSGVATLFLAAHLLGWATLAQSPLLTWSGVFLAAFAAVYTAFLFAQAEGRDLWQSALLPTHMLVQSIMAGAAALLIMSAFIDAGTSALQVLSWTFGIALCANLLLTVFGEFAVPHASDVAAAAARMITRGRYARFYKGSIILGALLPLLILVVGAGSSPLLALAGLLGIGGLFAYEWAFVMAPQQIPNN